LTMVVQNQSDWMHTENGDSEAMIAPTVVFPAPGGPVRISTVPSIPRRYLAAADLGWVPHITGRGSRYLVGLAGTTCGDLNAH